MPDPILDQVDALVGELVKRQRSERILDSYYEGSCPLPDAVVQAKVTRAYRNLMGLSEAPWGALIVNSVTDRLEVTGINSGDKRADSALMDVWQSNNLDSESKLAHNAALVSGRAFALVWPGEDGQPEISLDNQGQMVVAYQEGNRRRRIAALRYWREGNRPYVTLYRPDGIFKYEGPEDSTLGQYIEWERRSVPGEEWPVENPWGIVPVVELGVNRRLKPGSFPYARGEFEHCTALIDRINLLTFLGITVAWWAGFPVRVILGDKILRDDDDNPLPPFTAQVDSVVQFEDPDTKLDQFDAADRRNLSIYPELDQLSSITATPRHYMPMEQGFINLSADAIRASEGALIAKIPSHQATLGEGWEEVLRLAGLMMESPILLSQSAELRWRDHETRSLAERADAAVKLAPILPWSAVAEYALSATSEQLARWSADRAGDTMNTLIAAAQAPATGLPAASNGNNGGG